MARPIAHRHLVARLGRVLVGGALFAAALAACNDVRSGTRRMAVIGDFGSDGPDERAVADMIRVAAVDDVLSVGDNDYSSELGLMRSHATYTRFVGQYYGEYLSPDPALNHFWPAPGNHDWYTPPDIRPYLEYFPMLPRTPAEGRYYTVSLAGTADLGGIDLFSLDSDHFEPDGRTLISKQAVWLQGALAASTACWKLVFFHHPPYSSGRPGMYFVPELRWPFGVWGADAVFSGHEHYYERLEVDGLPYFISGLGGFSKFAFLTNPPPQESRARYNEDFGALFVTVVENAIIFTFRDVNGKAVDTLTRVKNCARR
jgi:hypothetical protein